MSQKLALLRSIADDYEDNTMLDDGYKSDTKTMSDSMSSWSWSGRFTLLQQQCILFAQAWVKKERMTYNHLVAFHHSNECLSVWHTSIQASHRPSQNMCRSLPDQICYPRPTEPVA
jgi:hypothetical protein